MTPRYVTEPRLSWCPPKHVVIDSGTGAILSKHPTADSANETAGGMNAARKL